MSRNIKPCFFYYNIIFRQEPEQPEEPQRWRKQLSCTLDTSFCALNYSNLNKCTNVDCIQHINVYHVFHCKFKQTFHKPETGREMGRKILMPFLKSVVLLDVMEIVPSDDNCTLHFHARNNACQNTATDAHISCEGAFLVYVCSLDGLLRYFTC